MTGEGVAEYCVDFFVSPEPAAVATQKEGNSSETPGAGICRCNCGEARDARARVPPSTRFPHLRRAKLRQTAASGARSDVPWSCG